MKSILRRLTIRIILATTDTVYNKSAKICIGAKKKDRVFRSNSRFDLNDIVTYPREIRKNTPAVLGNVQGTPDIVFRTCKIDKTVFINSTSSLPSQIVSFLFAAKANTNVAQKLLISATDRTRLEMQTRAALKPALITLTKKWEMKSLRLQIENTTTLSYLLKMGGTKNEKLIDSSSEPICFLEGSSLQ